MLGLLVPGVGMGGGGGDVLTGVGRIEFTLPCHRPEFAVSLGLLEYTLPPSVEEFGVPEP